MSASFPITAKIAALLVALLLATATMAQDKAAADPTYAQAMQSYADADLESAANSTAILTAKYPKSANVMLLSGNIAVARHQYDAAISAFDKGLRRVPKSDKELALKLYIGKAKALMGLDKYADAKATLDEAQLKAGGTIELHLLRAMSNEHMGYKWQAADDYVAAGASLPLYNFYVRTGDQAKADKLTEDYVKGIGREHKISPLMTVLRLSSGETYEAVNDMLHALEAGNYDEEALLQLDRAASAYLNLSLKTYVKRTADNGTVAHAYGRLLMSKGAYADALDVYKMASANGQSLSNDCAVDALDCLLHLHQFDAVDSLRHMVSPAALSALLADADHLESMLRGADNATADQCVAMADKNMQNGRWTPQTLAIRAQANYLMGNHSDAASDAQKCLALYAKHDAPEYPILNPPHADAPSVRHLSPSASNLSAALIALAILRSDDRQAAELYTQAVNSDVYRPELLYAAACLRSRQGHQAEAVALIDKALQAGFYDVEWLRRTPLLADARTEAAFGKLIAAYAGKATSPIDLSALNFQPGESHQTAAQKLPQYAPADMTEALRLYNAGQKREAFKMFQALMTEDPANGTAYLYRGLIYADEGLKADAISSLSTALRLLPETDKANRAKAVCRMAPLMTSAMPFNENVRNIALDAVDQEIKNQGRTPELLWARLCCQSEYHRDLADLNTVLQANISPSVNKEVHKSIGLSLSAKGDLNGAISAYTAALAIAPNDEQLLSLRSNACLHTADTLSAIRDLCRSRIANPQVRDRNILRMYYPYIQKALDDLATESATDSAKHDVANAKVELALRYGRTAEAYRLSKKLTGVRPSLQAQALIGMGLYRQAKSLLLACDSLQTNPEELRMLAEACMHMGELAAAHMYLKQAAALNPANPLIYAAQAEVSLLSDNLDAAAAYADTACALNPTAALMETLRICVQKGDYRSAGVLASECSNKWWYKADDNWWEHERMQKRKFIEQMRSDDSQDAEPGPYDDDEEEVDADVIADEDDEEDDDDWEYSASTKTPQWALSLAHRLWSWAGPTVAPQPSCSIGYYVYSAAIDGDDEGVKCGVDMARKEGTGYDWYYIALAYATTGADDLAAEALSTAFSRGFCHFHLIEEAPEFESLAESDKFANVVSRLKNEHVKSIASLLND